MPKYCKTKKLTVVASVAVEEIDGVVIVVVYCPETFKYIKQLFFAIA